MKGKLNRTGFLKTYEELNIWLRAKGFTIAPPRGNPALYGYSHYKEFINPLYGVEAYAHPILPPIAFVRDNSTHKLMFVNSGNLSDVLSIDFFKAAINAMIKEKSLKLTEQLEVLSLYETTI